MFSNNYFQFINNISRIFIHFFTHTYFYKYFQTIILCFLNTCTKRGLTLVECLHQTVPPQKVSRDEKKLSCLESERECYVNYIMATSIFFHCKFTILLCYDNPNFKWNTNSTCELGCKFFCTVAKLMFLKKKILRKKITKNKIVKL